MLYGFLKVFFFFLFKLWLRLEVRGTEHIPARGPVVLACNHLSLLDPPVLGEAATRRIHCMAKEELFHNPIFGYIIRSLGAFPVRRGAADRNAIKHGMELLKRGEVVAVFPEGTRSKTGALGRVGSGAFMMAAATKAEIVPVLVTGSDLHRHGGWPKVTVTFGAPLAYDKSKKATKEALAVINQMWVDSMIGLGASLSEAALEAENNKI